MAERKGKIFTVTGTMGSGKTEEAIRRAKRAKIAGLQILAFYPDTDKRRTPNTINSADGVEFPAIEIPTKCPYFILDALTKDTKVAVIDEAQFFPGDLLEVVGEMQSRGIRTHVIGLDMNFRGEPFSETLGKIMSVSYEVLKLHAVCMDCKNEEACVPQRLVKNSLGHWVPAPINADTVAVGDIVAEGEPKEKEVKIIYEARCLDCHELPETLDES